MTLQLKKIYVRKYNYKESSTAAYHLYLEYVCTRERDGMARIKVRFRQTKQIEQEKKRTAHKLFNY